MNELEEIRKKGFAGFAAIYLHHFIKESKPADEIDTHIYTQLWKLDSKLGTTASDQLHYCLNSTSRSDIIKVYMFALNQRFKIIIDH